MSNYELKKKKEKQSSGIYWLGMRAVTEAICSVLAQALPRTANKTPSGCCCTLCKHTGETGMQCQWKSRDRVLEAPGLTLPPAARCV